jgi:hypothetical protein
VWTLSLSWCTGLAQAKFTLPHRVNGPHPTQTPHDTKSPLSTSRLSAQRQANLAVLVKPGGCRRHALKVTDL